jgi:AraC-like DNA-binding protein
MERSIVAPDDTPVLSKLAGGYREMPPSPALRAHFRCAWMQVIPAGPVARIAVVPDGCVDIIWSQDRLSIAGPDLSAAVLDLPPGTAVTGVRFRAGAAANWLGLSISEITDQRLDLADLWGRRARDLAARIGEAPEPTEALARLQAGLAQAAAEVDPPARDMALAFRALGRGGGIAPLLDRLAISERSLRRRCHAAFGYGPKTLERILRFQRFLAFLQASPGAGLSAAAFAAGYADQAHLSREVRALSGLSPRGIARQLAA